MVPYVLPRSLKKLKKYIYTYLEKHKVCYRGARTFLGLPALALVAYLDGAHGQDDGDNKEEHAAHHTRDDGLVSLVLGAPV